MRRSVWMIAISIVGAWSCACVEMAETWANITGGDWIEPAFTLTKGPLLVLIDDPDGLVTEQRAIAELHKTISDNFLEFKVNRMIVPLAEWRRLQQTDRKYHAMSIRQIGEKLGAEQVLYLRVERFAVQAEPNVPVLKGEFAVRVKVISTDRKQDVRLWPEDDAGRRIAVSTSPTPMDGEKTAADVATEVGIKLGKDVAMLFYGHRELEK